MADRLDKIKNWNDLTVLVTGGTGSFGRKFVEIMLRDYNPKKLIVYSRDELKQHEMRQIHPDSGPSPMRYFIGDVRDKDRLYRAFNGVDIVVHAAALKQVPACEYNPLEAVKTNIDGAANIIDAAINAGVKRVLALSTDKAVNPVNLYGATKLVAEKLFVQANAYSGKDGTRFACVRYGNVVSSRGSVIPLFKKQRDQGVVTITDERMTRFWLTREQGVKLVIMGVELMQGGEVFVPKIPSMRIADLADVIAPDCQRKTIGIRAGEKLHEVLISEDESRNTVELEDLYIIQPIHPWWQPPFYEGARPMADVKFSSDENDWWLTEEELHQMIDQS